MVITTKKISLTFTNWKTLMLYFLLDFSTVSFFKDSRRDVGERKKVIQNKGWRDDL